MERWPYGSLVVSDNVLYGMTSWGGKAGMAISFLLIQMAADIRILWISMVQMVAALMAH